MCGRFSLFVPQSVVERRFEASAVDSLGERYNIAPGDDVAVVRADDTDTIDRHEWGLLPHWVDDPADWPFPINARAETIEEKPSFREAAEERRCLVLADGYYEWSGTRGAKQPYRVTLEGGGPLAFAGLWDRWTSDGDERRTVTIVTTEANATVAPVYDRMPAILEPAEESRWLDADDPAERGALLDPYPDDSLEAFPISRAVNDPANDDPSLVEPIDIGEQTDLGEFS